MTIYPLLIRLTGEKLQGQLVLSIRAFIQTEKSTTLLLYLREQTVLLPILHTVCQLKYSTTNEIAGFSSVYQLLERHLSKDVK